jgi:hypothetical protein
MDVLSFRDITQSREAPYAGEERPLLTIAANRPPRPVENLGLSESGGCLGIRTLAEIRLPFTR